MSLPRATARWVEPEIEERELREYLGERFDRRHLVDYEGTLERELEETADEALLYRTSEAYLYNLTAFAMSGTKEPYLDVLHRHVPPPARLLDFGCGIGSDGLALARAGYEVSFADFDNPSTRYLRWRLEQRGLRADIFDLDRDQVPTGFDLVYAFDVLEHVPDPVAALERMEAAAGAVLVNLLEAEAGETALHHELPVRGLVARAARMDLRHYQVLHRRSHLLLYGTERAAGLDRARSRARVALGRLRSFTRRPRVP